MAEAEEQGGRFGTNVLFGKPHCRRAREMQHSEARATQAQLAHLHLRPVTSTRCHVVSCLLRSPTNIQKNVEMSRNTESDIENKTTSSVCALTLLQEGRKTTHQPDEGAIWGMWKVTMATQE